MIRYDHDQDGIVTLTWDMPDRKQNVFNAGSMAAFTEALDRALGTEGVTGIVITSAKKDFIAGADLEMIQAMATSAGRDPGELSDDVGTLGRILRKMETGGVPVVAAINGTRSAAASSSASRPTTASVSTTRAPSSGCRRARSASSRAPAARSACRGSSASRRRCSCSSRARRCVRPRRRRSASSTSSCPRRS
jgi:hypothetical protein